MVLTSTPGPRCHPGHWDQYGPGDTSILPQGEGQTLGIPMAFGNNTWTSTQTLAAVGPQTHTWPLPAVQAQTSHGPCGSLGHPYQPAPHHTLHLEFPLLPQCTNYSASPLPFPRHTALHHSGACLPGALGTGWAWGCLLWGLGWIDSS